MSDFGTGSQWNRWDLHFHTPSSFDYEDKSVTDQDIVDRLVSEGIRVVAITDHHTIDVARVKKLQMLGSGKITVLPGIELRDDHGGDPIHYICLFPEDCDLNHVWITLQGRLDLTPVGIANKGGDEGVYVPIEEGASATLDLGGMVSIHAGSKSNSIESIRNQEQFQRRIKYDITQACVHLMEIGQIKDIHIHREKIFPTTGLEKPLIICSDNHNVRSYAVKANLWFRADPTFRGLLMVLREPWDRVYIGSKPPTSVRIEQNRTKYIRRVTFARKDGSGANRWFSGSVEFNHGLVAIVGNKGSGKSALADTLGLLGSTRKSDSFSFLNDGRFRHPTSGYASQYVASLEWESGETLSRCLADKVAPDEVERIKYLPQDHVERVCNEIAAGGEEGFEQELKTVIFSHVPETQRSGHKTLDDLVRFRSGEKQKRIDSLQKQLRDLSRTRGLLEAKVDPTARRELEQKIHRKYGELQSHDEAKPLELARPAAAADRSGDDIEVLASLQTVESRRLEIAQRIEIATSTLSGAERRLVIARRILEKLDNFRKDYEVFSQSLQGDVAELGLAVTDLVSLTIDSSKPSRFRDELTARIREVTGELESREPPGLRRQKEHADLELIDLQSKLDAPNRAYQAFLKAVVDWEDRRRLIEGEVGDADSLKGLQASLDALDGIPEQIEQVKKRQIEIALQIYAEKVGQAEVYRELYLPVQQFIDVHNLAKDKLKLEFRAELIEFEFAKRLLEHVSQNRKGSFMGLEEGKGRAERYAQVTDWTKSGAVQKFLEVVDDALHFNLRDSDKPSVPLKVQLVSGKKPEEVFNYLYGLDYVSPRYVLRWEGKDLSMLSPGERGTLLLVFYLLIDKGDMPLIIDQPEGNLDNHTVAKMLVDCIKEARNRRQVFIVTHNPNLAVVCDADQVIHASMDKEAGHAVTYTSGALENAGMSKFITDVLEGTRWAFGVRSEKYGVAE
jgi:ABC-type lipoprotein export system ATPase subunit